MPRDLAHAQRAIADDKAATAHLSNQGRGRGEPIIDTNPGGIGIQLGEHERCYHRREHLPDRREGLLKKRRDESGQQKGQRMSAPKGGRPGQEDQRT